MGSMELNLLLKFGVPLAVKLLVAGKDEKEVTDTVTAAVSGMAAGKVEIGKALLAADEKQTQSIIDGLLGVIVGTVDAFGGLIKAFLRLLGGSQ